MENKAILTKKQGISGCFWKAGFLNVFMFLIALALGAIFSGPYMTLEKDTAQVIFFVFLGFYLAISILSLFFLLKARNKAGLLTAGPYKFVRHPMYGAIIFILNPALGILLRSWFLILACVPAYFIWRSGVENEEKNLMEIFKGEYLKYETKTWRFFPNLLKTSRPLFFGLATFVIFLFIFIVLNSSSLYLSAVQWPADESSAAGTSGLYETPNIGSLPIENPKIAIVRPKYNKTNSIVIEKLNIDAPLVFATGTTQKELDSALDKGILIYPGSKLPGDLGEVFLSGHSSVYIWNKTPYGQIFASLDKLEAGDIVTIYYNQYKYDYKIEKKEIVAPQNTMLDAQINSKTLTLMTCWPVGTSKNRLLVRAEQID